MVLESWLLMIGCCNTNFKVSVVNSSDQTSNYNKAGKQISLKAYNRVMQFSK